MSWTLREHKKEPKRLAHLLYWHSLVRPHIVYQNNHSLLSTLTYRGDDTESSSMLDMTVGAEHIHRVLKQYEAPWSMHFEMRRFKAPAYPTSSWSHPVTALIDEERRAQVGEPGSHFTTQYWLTMTYHLPKKRARFWKKLWWKHIPEGSAQSDEVAWFDEDITRLHRDLSHVLEHVEILENSGLMTYLKSTVSMTEQTVKVPAPPTHLGYRLTDMELRDGATPTLGPYWLRMSTIKGDATTTGYPDTTYPGIIDDLHDLPDEYRYVVRWIPLARNVAAKKLAKLERIYNMATISVRTRAHKAASHEDTGIRDTAAELAQKECAHALALCKTGQATFGYLTQTIITWDTDFAIAEEKRERAEHALRAKGFVVGTETLNSTEAWLGTIPGDCYHNVREPFMDSLTLCGLVATTSVWSGPSSIPHLDNGPPLMVGTGKGNTLFNVGLHNQDVADTMLIGRKGSGKSGLAAFLNAQWDRYPNSRTITIEKGRSMQALTHAVGGTWMELAPGKSLPLQPLAHINDPAERAWGMEWTGDTMECEGIQLIGSAKREIQTAIDTLAHYTDTHAYTLSGLTGMLQSKELRQAIEPYTLNGQYGTLTDGDTDHLRFGKWTCFEMETLVEKMPRVIPVILPIIFHRITTVLDGNPTMITLDEVWVMLLIEIFVTRIRDWLNTLRKKNAFVVFITQTLAAIDASPIADTIRSACLTKIFCPDTAAIDPNSAGLYTGYGLTERQRELIGYALPKRQYYFKGPAGCRLFELEMGPIAQALCGRSSLTDVASIDRVYRTRTEPFAVAWLRDQGLTEEADALKTTLPEETTDETHADTDTHVHDPYVLS
jgi:type IV secretion system protein VirB4